MADFLSTKITGTGKESMAQLLDAIIVKKARVKFTTSKEPPKSNKTVLKHTKFEDLLKETYGAFLIRERPRIQQEIFQAVKPEYLTIWKNAEQTVQSENQD
jgi:hypothetical protein